MNPGKMKLNHVQRRTAIRICIALILCVCLVVTVVENRPVYIEPWDVWLRQVAVVGAAVAAGCLAR